MLTQDNFQQACMLNTTLADKWYLPLTSAVSKYLDYSPLRMAYILAHVGHESDGFVRLEENLMYRTDQRIIEIFGRRNGLNFATASQLVGNPKALANFVYGGIWGAQNLGNTQPDDGYKYRGSGLIQITGKRNFAEIADAIDINIDLLSDLMRRDPNTASTSAIWWICHNGLLEYFDRDDLSGSTKIINGALSGLEDRHFRLEHAKNVLAGD